MVSFQVYRQSTIGKTLTEALEEMILSGKLTRELAVRVQNQFDESITAALQEQVTSTAFFKGNLRTYNHVDKSWTFTLTDTEFTNDSISENIGNVKIVAYNHLMKYQKPPQQQ